MGSSLNKTILIVSIFFVLKCTQNQLDTLKKDGSSNLEVKLPLKTADEQSKKSAINTLNFANSLTPKQEKIIDSISMELIERKVSKVTIDDLSQKIKDRFMTINQINVGPSGGLNLTGDASTVISFFDETEAMKIALTYSFNTLKSENNNQLSDVFRNAITKALVKVVNENYSSDKRNSVFSQVMTSGIQVIALISNNDRKLISSFVGTTIATVVSLHKDEIIAAASGNSQNADLATTTQFLFTALTQMDVVKNDHQIMSDSYQATLDSVATVMMDSTVGVVGTDGVATTSTTNWSALSLISASIGDSLKKSLDVSADMKTDTALSAQIDTAISKNTIDLKIKTDSAANLSPQTAQPIAQTTGQEAVTPVATNDSSQQATSTNDQNSSNQNGEQQQQQDQQPPAADNTVAIDKSKIVKGLKFIQTVVSTEVKLNLKFTSSDDQNPITEDALHFDLFGNATCTKGPFTGFEISKSSLDVDLALNNYLIRSQSHYDFSIQSEGICMPLSFDVDLSVVSAEGLSPKEEELDPPATEAHPSSTDNSSAPGEGAE